MSFLDDPAGPLVRPFFITKGRTRTNLPIEAMVVSNGSAQPGRARLDIEHWSILDLCARPLAVAEIAARLRLPIGVARVLIADLAGFGFVEMASDEPEADELAFLERLMAGIERL